MRWPNWRSTARSPRWPSACTPQRRRCVSRSCPAPKPTPSKPSCRTPRITSRAPGAVSALSTPSWTASTTPWSRPPSWPRSSAKGTWRPTSTSSRGTRWARASLSGRAATACFASRRSWRTRTSPSASAPRGGWTPPPRAGSCAICTRRTRCWRRGRCRARRRCRARPSKRAVAVAEFVIALQRSSCKDYSCTAVSTAAL
mmetsp:Transcript_43945/g.110284  ORF Transcript_43945/g.110284 Transcript_43945/m.110284 type:complete len:200 (+) Transcript_43945:598-1197(+)